MPTYSFTRTREQIRDKILRKLGVLGAGQAVSGEDVEIVYEAMDLRLKELHEIGVIWYQVAGGVTDVSLVASTATANAPADCLFPVSMCVRIGTEDRDLDVIGHREYQAITDKLQTGEPEKVFFSGGVFRFYPVPQISYTAKLTYEAIAADTEDGTAPDIEVSMMRAFAELVAGDLVDDFGVPEQKAVRLIAQQGPAMRTIRALNPQRSNPNTTEVEYF